MAETNGPIWTTASILKYRQEYAQQKRIVKVEQEILKNIDRRAKANGIPTKLVQAEQRVLEMDPEESREFIRERAQVSVVINGPQLDIMSTIDGSFMSEEERKQASLNRAEDLGFRCGKSGLPDDDNPYDPTTEEFAMWETWWRKGAEAMDRVSIGMGDGAVSVRASRKQPSARQRERAPSIQEATFGDRADDVVTADDPEQPGVEPAEPPWNPEPRFGKRKRGRPPKARDPNAPKRPRGRPPKVVAAE